MADLPKSWKGTSTEKKVGVGAGVATFSAGMIDLRPKAKIKNIKHLGSTWQDVKKHVKAGDVLIGANRTAPQSIRSGVKDFKKYYKRSRASGLSRRKSFKKAFPQLDAPSIVSKFSNPESSHAAVFSTKGGAVSYGGGSWAHVTEAELPKNKKERDILKRKTGEKAHFTLMRPKKGVSKIPEITRKKGAITALNIASRKAGSQKDYKGVRAIGNQIVDWATPKFKGKERLKTKSQLAIEKCYVGGTCGTTGALMSDKTVGGKTAPKVLPKDYLRSADYDVVGKIGTGKTSRVNKAIFSTPKYIAKSLVAAGVAGAAYGAVKGYKKLKKTKADKITKTAEDIYQESFNDELEKLGFKFPWQKKKRKKKKEPWKEKFASMMAGNVQEYDIKSRFAKSFGRFISKRGL